MTIPTPSFWKQKGILSNALLPLSWLYGGAIYIRNYIPCTPLPHPKLVCIGNLTVGGTGKTPLCLDTAQRLGGKLCFMSKGYGGSLQQPTRLEAWHSAKEAGDEPLLLRKLAPVWVGKSRRKTLQAIINSGVKDFILMDDGLQNKEVKPAFNVIVIDTDFGFGNERLLPAGPLREPLELGLQRADLVVLLGQDTANAQVWHQRTGKPTLTAKLSNPILPKDKRYYAFCAIGRPEKFMRSFKKQGIKLTGFKAFPDHHPFRKIELENLAKSAKGAQLITTDKDWQRLPNFWRKQVQILPMHLEWQGPSLADYITNLAL